MAGNLAIRAYRERQRLSQEALGAQLDVDGITVSRWETGTRKIAMGLLPRVSERTGIPIRELRPDLFELVGEAAQ